MVSWWDHEKEVADPERFKEFYPSLMTRLDSGENNFTIDFGIVTYVVHRTKKSVERYKKEVWDVRRRMKVDIERSHGINPHIKAKKREGSPVE